jgi:cytochrome c556
MKKTAIGLTIGAALFVGTVFAQGGHAEFKEWMKTTAGSFSSLRKTVEAKDGPATAETAEKLAGIFAQVRGHFEEHKAQDGIDFANQAREASNSLAAAAKAGEWEKAQGDLKSIGATCQGCHAAHREKLPDGTFKMK